MGRKTCYLRGWCRGGMGWACFQWLPHLAGPLSPGPDFCLPLVPPDPNFFPGCHGSLEQVSACLPCVLFSRVREASWESPLACYELIALRSPQMVCLTRLRSDWVKWLLSTWFCSGGNSKRRPRPLPQRVGERAAFQPQTCLAPGPAFFISVLSRLSFAFFETVV